MTFLKSETNPKTFDQVLESKKPGSRRVFKTVFINFEKFSKENYHRNMEEIVREFLKVDQSAIFNTLQEWVNFNKSKSPKTVTMWFSCLCKYLRHRGVDLSNAKDHINFRSYIEEEKYPLSLDDIQKILSVAGYTMKLKLLTQLSSGMRRGEMLQLRRKDFIIDKRIIIKIPARIAKFNKARTTFVSSEVQKMLIPRLKKLNDNDFVFGSESVKDKNIGDSYEQNLTRYLEKLSLDMRYESTGYHKINTHSFRAYFITKISRHDENIAKKLAGQKGYMLQYDRMTDEEKLEKYIEFESDLYIYKQKPKSEEIQELTRKLEEYQKRDLSDKDADKIIEQMRKTRPEWIKAVESAYTEVHKKTTIALNEEMKRKFGMTDNDLEEFHVWKKGMIKKIKQREMR